MSLDKTGIITWLRSWFDDIYSLKGEESIGFNDVYPLGSIYMSVNNVNPSILFGGNWEQIKDRFLLAKGDTYATNGATGGEASHTLNINEMPSHNHTQAQHRHKQANKYSNGSGSASAYVYSSNRTAVDHYTDYQTPTINNTGGGQAHNNMPPYLVVNVWKRIPYYYNASTISWNVTSVSNNIGRKCYKNIHTIPDSDYFTVECIANVVSIGKWFSSGLCLTVGEPADNTTNSSENYSRKMIVSIYSTDGYTNNAAIKGSGGINLDKSTDYLLKFVVRNKNHFDWQISDLNGNILSNGSFESDISSYTHLSYYSFEGVNMSIREFNVY